MKKAADARYYERNADTIKDRVGGAYHDLSDEAKKDRRAKNRARPKHADEKVRERERLRVEVLAAYGARCSCCGTTYEPHLTLDHVEGGGTRERKERKGTNLYRVARQEGFPPRFQILCWNCNWTKHKHGACGCSEPLLKVVS
jgi:hypothetical protein